VAIRINRVYTRTGDKGTTRLVGGGEVAKDSPRVDAYGTIDELNSVIGLARVFNGEALGTGDPTKSARGSGARAVRAAGAQQAARELDEVLRCLQNELFDVGSELATPPGGEYPGMFVVGASDVTALEKRIDRCQKDLAPLKSFILPGGGRVGAFLHQARTVCRRAERDVLRLSRVETVSPDVVKYLNRLSDLLFVLARWIAQQADQPEYLWERGLRLPESEPPTKESRRG
jgi:cob(I)alamin adenosyltransferase